MSTFGRTKAWVKLNNDMQHEAYIVNEAIKSANEILGASAEDIGETMGKSEAYGQAVGQYFGGDIGGAVGSMIGSFYGSVTSSDVPDVDLHTMLREAGLRPKFHLDAIRNADDAIESAEIDLFNMSEPNFETKFVDLATIFVDKMRAGEGLVEENGTQFQQDKEAFGDWMEGQKEEDKWYPGKNIEKRREEAGDDMPYLEDYDFDILGDMEAEIQADMDEKFASGEFPVTEKGYQGYDDFSDVSTDIGKYEPMSLEFNLLSQEMGTKDFNKLMDMLVEANEQGLIDTEELGPWNVGESDIYNYFVNTIYDGVTPSLDEYLKQASTQSFDSTIDEALASMYNR